MSPHTDPTASDRRGNVAGRTLFWLGGGRDIGVDRPEGAAMDRSHYQVAGAVVLLAGLLTWAIATLAIAAGTDAPVLAILPFTLVFGAVVAALSRAIASGRHPSGRGLVGRALVAVAIGVVVGELAATVLFGSAIVRGLNRDAAEQAASRLPWSPPVTASIALVPTAPDSTTRFVTPAVASTTHS